MRFSSKLFRFAYVLPLTTVATLSQAQLDPLSFVSVTPITDNNPSTNEVGRDRVAINSTAFKNESLWTVGNFQFTSNYREDGKLMVARRDLNNPVNDWDIVVTEFTSYNINDSHNVPVIGIDGDGYLHLAWGTHVNPLLYTRSTTPITSGQPMSFVGQATGNAGAINTMTGSNEGSTTYPNFIRDPGSGDLLFNYRTGSSGNGTYRITHWDDATDTWSWADQVWMKNTDSSGLTYNAYPHNLTYDANGGLHASWTYRYNNSSPTGNSGFQTNHNLFYAYSPDHGVTWFKDLAGTVPYGADIDESNAQVIVNIPEGSSLINTGTQAIDRNDRPAIATWWAPRANDAAPDHRRQYMYVGNDGSEWFTSQITHRRSDPNSPVPESQLGLNHMGRPQIVFDEYNRAFVVYKDNDNGGGVTVAYSQAESRDDWEFIKLTTDNLGRFEPTLDRALWEADGQMHLLIQQIDGNSGNGGSELQIVEWDSASALGRVLKWAGQSGTVWDGTSTTFTDLGSPTDFNDFDNVTFDDTAGQGTVVLQSDIDAGKVVVDTANSYIFSGTGALTSGSLSVVGGGSLELATSGNTYDGPTRVSNATLLITGDATAMTSKMIVADGGTLVMDSSDASTMSSAFEVWPTGTLQIGTPTSTTDVFPNSPSSILNDGLIRVYANQTLQGVTGWGSIEIAGGTTTLQNNGGLLGGLTVKSGATAIAADSVGLGASQSGHVMVEDGGQLRLGSSGTFSQQIDLAGEGAGAGALQIAPSVDANLTNNLTLSGASTSFDVAAAATATIQRGLIGTGGLSKQGSGSLHLQGDNSYSGKTIVREGLLILDQNTGLGETIVESGGVLKAVGTVRDDLTVLGGGALRINTASAESLSTLFHEDFSGTGNALNGTSPDVAFNGSSWVAADTFKDNGQNTVANVSAFQSGGSATLAFTPEDGNVYTLEASLENIVGDTDWFGVGFASGQSTLNNSSSRFITGDVEGLAWALYRGAQSGTTNSTFLGDTSVEPNSGLASGSSAWLAAANAAGGDVSLRLILDTTGGAGNWSVSMEADTGSGFQLIRAAQTLLDEAITSVGIANSRTTDITGSITSFSLTTDSVPVQSRTLTVLGDVSLNAGSTLEMNLFSATDHDRLDVEGVFALGGTLAVALESGAVVPQLNDTFDLFDFQAVTGTFDVLDLPNLGPGLAWDTSGLSINGELVVIDFVAAPGDTDGDGDIDDSDLGTSFANYTGPVGAAGGKSAAQGDTDGDGDVDDSDLGTSFAGYTGPLSPSSVPEPTSLAALLALGMLTGGRPTRVRRETRC